MLSLLEKYAKDEGQLSAFTSKNSSRMMLAVPKGFNGNIWPYLNES
jgi:hypothetical protein